MVALAVVIYLIELGISIFWFFSPTSSGDGSSDSSSEDKGKSDFENIPNESTTFLSKDKRKKRNKN